VLICASLEPSNAGESIQALRFGEACSRIEMRAGRSADGAATLRRLVEEIDSEIAACQAIIVRDQRWERRVTVRHDVVELKDDVAFEQTTETIDGLLEDEAAAGVMVVGRDEGKGTTQTVAHEVVANVLVGAEEAEAQLEGLLQRKRELLGEA